MQRRAVDITCDRSLAHELGSIAELHRIELHRDLFDLRDRFGPRLLRAKTQSPLRACRRSVREAARSWRRDGGTPSTADTARRTSDSC
jgi:hypothetical protein